MRKTTYRVTTVSDDETGRIISRRVGEYRSMTGALKAAHRAAGSDHDCQSYGPSAVCVVGAERTAVIAW